MLVWCHHCGNDGLVDGKWCDRDGGMTDVMVWEEWWCNWVDDAIWWWYDWIGGVTGMVLWVGWWIKKDGILTGLKVCLGWWCDWVDGVIALMVCWVDGVIGLMMWETNGVDGFIVGLVWQSRGVLYKDKSQSDHCVLSWQRWLTVGIVLNIHQPPIMSVLHHVNYADLSSVIQVLWNVSFFL